MKAIRALVDGVRCVYYSNRAARLLVDIADRQREADAWPIIREAWQREVVHLQGRINSYCGKPSGHVVRSLMPRDK